MELDWNNTATIFNITLEQNTTTTTTTTRNNMPQWYESGKIQIPLYAIIFMLAVVGNTLVILTLIQNQRMRTITNLFLLNLAVSDLLLGVLCMPFTLIGALLRDFVFGEVMCKLLPFLQACSVSVGVWTLVAISVERYYAICHPLRSLRWQTLSHAYKLILAIWLGSLVCMAPIAALSRLKPTNQGNHKCREDWPNLDYERAYNLFLDAILLIIPLLVLALTYSLITQTLCRGMRTEKTLRDHSVNNGLMEVYVNLQGGGSSRKLTYRNSSRARYHNTCSFETDSTSQYSNNPGLRRSNAERGLVNKKRVIKMLFAVVLEFFICWTPLYTINTIALFDPSIVYNNLGYTGISFCQLLAYSSSCCNPITYCFMNCGFRKSFVNLFRCLRRFKGQEMAAGYGLTPASEINLDSKWVNKCSVNN